MRRFRTLTRMAMHEMWISSRWIPVIGLPILGGLVVIALPPELAGVSAVAGAGFSYAIAACVAIAISSGLAAGTMAHERRRGTVAWMAVRAVPRSAVLLSWFVAFGILLTTGMAIGSLGAWLAAIARAESAPDFGPFAAAVAATDAASLATVAAGLLIGTFLRIWPATLVALALAAAVLTVAVAGPLAGVPLPTGGIGLLAHLDTAARPISSALQSAGAALATAAVLLVLAGVGLERADL